MVHTPHRVVRGYHGTILEHAAEMAQGRFVEHEKNVYRWLGSGIYFFEENFDAAQRWAEIRARKLGARPAILKADINLDKCLDLTRAAYQSIVRNAYRDKSSEWEKNGTRPSQKPFELHGGQVRSGYHGDWENYGRNELDYRVIEHAMVIAKAQENLDLDTVRGVFLELGPLFDDSWLYEGAHVAVAVRHPYVNRLSDLKCLDLS